MSREINSLLEIVQYNESTHRFMVRDPFGNLELYQDGETWPQHVKSYYKLLGYGEASYLDGGCDYETRYHLRCGSAGRFMSPDDDGTVCCGSHYNHEADGHCYKGDKRGYTWSDYEYMQMVKGQSNAR